MQRFESLGCVLVGHASGTAATTASGRPDRVLYQKAEEALAHLDQSEARMGQRREWERVVARYREVVTRYFSQVDQKLQPLTVLGRQCLDVSVNPMPHGWNSSLLGGIHALTRTSLLLT